MKKSTKTIMILATVCVTLGLALTGTAFALADFNPKNLSTVPDPENKSYLAKFNDFDKVVFEGVSENVRIESTTDESFSIEYYESDYLSFDIIEDGTTFRITENIRPQFMVFNLNFNFDYTVVIKVPESFTGNMNISSVSGSITIEDFRDIGIIQARSTSDTIRISNVLEANEIDINSMSGSLSAHTLSAKSLSLSTTSGDINASNIEAELRTQAETTSGDISLENIIAKTMNTSSHSGSINGRTTSADSIAATTTSGWIHLTDVEASNVTGNSTSGDVTFSLRGSAEDYFIATSSVSGDINVPASGRGAEKTVDLSTISGDIRLEFV